MNTCLCNLKLWNSIYEDVQERYRSFFYYLEMNQARVHDLYRGTAA